MKKSDWYWLLGTLCFWLFLFLLVGMLFDEADGLDFDYHWHDTYYVFSTSLILIYLSSIVFFLSYTIRTLLQKFKHPRSNFILLMSCMGMWFVVGQLSQLYKTQNSSGNQLIFNATKDEWVVHPPLSSHRNDESNYDSVDTSSKLTKTYTLITRSIQLIILVVGFITLYFTMKYFVLNKAKGK